MNTLYSAKKYVFSDNKFKLRHKMVQPNTANLGTNTGRFV